MSDEPMIIRVDADGKPLDPLPPGYTFAGFYNSGQNYSGLVEQNYARGAEGRMMAGGALPQQPPPMQTPQQPPAWDWQNPPVGADGKPIGPGGDVLPYGAERFDPFGRPYYGEGLQGWWKGIVSRFKDPSVPTAPLPEDWRKLIVKGVGEQVLSAGDLSKMLPTAVQAFEMAAEQAEAATAERGAPSVLTFIGRAVKEGVSQLFAGAGLAAEGAEAGYYGTVRGLQEVGKTSDMPDLPTFGDPNESWLADIFNLNYGLLGIPYNLYRAAKSPLSWDDKKAIMGEQYQAARIAYSQFGNATMREEFIRRYRAGENPELLAMEMQNTGAELIGTLLFDPLNVIGIGGKAAKSGRMLKEADYAMKVVDPTIAKALDNFAAVAGDGAAAEAIENLVDANQAVVAATRMPLEELAKLDRQQVVGHMVEMARTGHDYSPWALTASGKRYVISATSGDLLGWIAANFGASDAPDVLLAMVKSASSNADEALEGLSTLIHAKTPQPFFSQAGYQTRVLLRRLLEDADGAVDADGFIKTVEKYGDDAAGLATYLGKKLDDITNDMIPDVEAGRKAAEAVKKGGVLAEETTFLANWYNGLSPVVKAIDRFNNALQIPVGSFNRFFAGIYMGMSPGYALRNALNNTFTTLVDLGPRAGLEAGLTSFQNFFKPGSMAARADETIRGWLGGIFNKGASVGFAGPGASVNISTKGVFGLFAAKAQDMELGAAKVISARSIDRTMRSMLKPGRALPDLTVLLDKGWTREGAQYLADLVVKHHGDLKAAKTEAAAWAATGRIDVVKNLSAWLTPADTKALHKFGFFEPLQKSIDEAFAEGDMGKAVASIQELRNSVAEMAAKLADEVPMAVPEQMDEVMGTLRDLDRVLPDESADLVQRSMVANSVVFRAYENALNDIMHTMGTNPEVQMFAKSAWYRTRMLLQSARDTSDTFTRNIWYWNDKIKANVKMGVSYWQSAERLGLPKKSYKNAVDFYVELWKKVGMPDMPIEEMAKLLWANEKVTGRTINVRKAFLDWMWDGHFKGSRIRHWGEARLQYEQAMEEFFTKAQGMADVSKLPDLKRARDASEVAKVLDTAEELPTGLIVPYLDGQPPTLPRVYYEQQDKLFQLFDRTEQGLTNNWSKTEPFTPGDTLRQMDDYFKASEPGIAKARLTAASVADAERDFALLNYNKKTYFDLAAAYIFPYHFWYNRTYGHWLRRLVYNPEVIAAYSKYRGYMEKTHADMPEWWRYQINTNDLLGMDSENPLYFNLEAAINPLNGITGVDFNDPYRRVNWWTRALDDLAKFGPSLWTPISLATAVALNARGETEAAARWAGRFIPQTAAIKSLGALLHVGGPGGPELDPAVQLLSGGLDPYERRRVGRALGTMIQEGAITEAQAMDAAHSQQGQIWDTAKQRAAEARAPGQLASFLGGVGFKMRSQQEQEIDLMYQDYRMLWANEGNLAPDEFRVAMEQLRDKYPFMDAVLLSRRGGIGRDRQYAYNVLSRLPPGQKSAIAEAAGVSPDLFGQFYDTKGHMELWDKTERDRFMSAVVDIGSLLEMPDTATRTEWNQATAGYNKVSAMAESVFGADIWERVDMYYAAKGDSFEDQQRAEAILNADPAIGEALDFRNQQILFDPLLQAYYGGLDKLRGYYKSQMYDAVFSQLGEDIFDTWTQYYNLKNTGQDTKAFWKAHPELEKYIDMRNAWDGIINQSVARIGLQMRQGLPAEFRNDAAFNSLTKQAMAGALEQQQPNLTWSEWRTMLPDALLPFLGQDNLPPAVVAELEYIAGQMGLPPEQMYQMILQALASNQ